jgi:hypothetical protein
MNKEKFDIKKIAEMICDELYDYIDIGNCYQTLWAEIEYNGYIFNAEVRAEIEWGYNYILDEYNNRCDFTEIEDIKYKVIDLYICDAGGNDYEDEELVKQLTKLIEE